MVGRMKSRSSNFRRLLAAASLLVSGLLLVVWSILMVGLEFPSDPRGRLEMIGANYGRMMAIAILFGVAQIVLIPAVLGIVHLTRERAPFLAHFGGTLAILGIAGHLVFTGSSFAGFAIVEIGIEPGHVQIFERASQHPALLPFLGLGLAGTFFGFLLLAAALWRARTAPLLVPAAMAAGFLLEFVLTALHPILGVLGTLLVAGAFIRLMFPVWRMSAEDWEAVSASAPA
jgi:hypothetical protein